jgi:hypothetical protein
LEVMDFWLSLLKKNCYFGYADTRYAVAEQQFFTQSDNVHAYA